VAGPKARMVEARFVFQTVPAGADKEYVQFDVAFFKRDGRLRVAFDLGSGEGQVENVEVSVLEVMKAAVEAVKGRVKVEEMHEQVE